jgi:glycosyltransferase involved in cell wall biosynthesis
LGHPVIVLLHATADAPGLGGLAALDGVPGIEVRVLEGMPGIDEAVPEPRPELGAYVRAIEDLSRGGTRRVVAFPTYSAECYGLLAAASRTHSEVLRTIGWMHSDIAYDRLTLLHYSRLIHRFVGVSLEMVGGLRRGLPEREGDVRWVPYGVEIPRATEHGLSRKPSRGTGPLRLVYTGRMDLEQKRVHAMVAMSDELCRSGIGHELVLVGDGPAAGVIDGLIAGSPHIRRVSVQPDEIARWLDWAEVFVLASRYEGLSLSMLEAMAHGCVPVVTRVSGATDAVGEGESACGVVVDSGPGVDEPGLGSAMADGVRRAADMGIAGLGAAARARAEQRFSEEAMARAVSALCAEVVGEPGRRWPSDVPAAAGDFTVPSDAAERAARVLDTLSGCRVAIWGAGRHTRVILRVLGENSPMLRAVTAVLDDGVVSRGQLVGPWEVVGASGLAALGITDVVISSALHEDALWARRHELERLGIRVHRLY